jgi:hypothetical protein
MTRTTIMRGALWIGGIYNLAAALAFAFPGSLGRLAGLPAPGSLFYAWMLALFGGAYLWLARRPQIDRPLVGLAVIGKLSVFALAVVCWTLGEIPARVVVPAVGDLVFALVFLWWLRGEAGVRGSSP